MEELRELHQEWMAEVIELFERWSDKSREESTCKTCDNDPWELFLLITALSMIKEGTKYLDRETASDTSSEVGDDEEVDNDMEVDSDDDDSHDSKRDDNEVQVSNSESEQDSALNESSLDPQLLQIDDSEEPPRPSTGGAKLQQRLLKNFGPNQYILRIVSIRTYGCGKVENPQFKVCPRCGYRLNGENLDEDPLAYFLLHRVVGRICRR